VREADLAAWKTWNKTHSDAAMSEVLRLVDPLIQKETNRWTGTLARPLLELEAKRLAVEAIQSFSPTGGAALGTHVVNRMKKLSRLSYSHQNIARIPEYKTLKFHSFNLANSALQDKFGRDPTDDELTDELGWPKSYLENYRKSFRKEFIESGETPPIFDAKSEDSGMVDFMFHDLTPIQKKIFQHTTGYAGMPVLNNPDLMKELKMTQGQLSYQKRRLVDHIALLTNEGTGG
jgi:DNA-directed RNA polymerase specialized sigma subunit